jgi:hypothetical protein
MKSGASELLFFYTECTKTHLQAFTGQKNFPAAMPPDPPPYPKGEGKGGEEGRDSKREKEKGKGMERGEREGRKEGKGPREEGKGHNWGYSPPSF